MHRSVVAQLRGIQWEARVIYVVRYALIVVYTVILGTLATALALVDRSGEAVIRVGRWWVAWILGTCRIEVECTGLENVARPGAQIFMSNHQSVFDISAIIRTIPVSFRFVAKRELTWIPLFGWAMALGGHIIVDRGNRTRAIESLRRGAEQIRQGANVIVFPEGTRSPQGDLGEFKSGGFHLAIEAGVPIVPVSVSGSRRITPKRSLRIESGRIRVVYGKPIATADLRRADRDHLKATVRGAITAGMDRELEASGPDD